MMLRVDPRPVAAARIGLGVAALINTMEIYLILLRLDDGRLAMPVVAWTPEVNYPIAQGFLTIAITAAVALVLGVGTRVAGLAYAAAVACALLLDQQTYSSHQLLVMLLVAYLAFAESEAAWSVARRSGPRRDVPWWPQLLMMTQVTVCYLFAGVSKINAEFLSGEPLSLWVRWSPPEWAFVPLAVAAVVTEVVVLAVGLWVPRVRRLSVAVGVGLHISIVVMLDFFPAQLVVFALACFSVYPLFLTRPPLWARGADGSRVSVGGVAGATLIGR